jgi:hypothetical protein
VLEPTVAEASAEPVSEASDAMFKTFSAEAVFALPAAAFSLPATTAAFEAGAATTDRTPAVSADTATSAMRCFIVFVDICFLSLVELGNFPISARRSC